MKCEVYTCKKPSRRSGLCGMHHQRKLRGQDLLAPSRYQFEKCSVPNCSNKNHHTHKREANPHKYCRMHLARWQRHGHIQQTRNLPGFGRHKDMEGYILMQDATGKYRYEHIILAEKALGKSLPHGARVHHMNEIRDDNYTPLNLVVCPNEGYHQLLHKRMRALKCER